MSDSSTHRHVVFSPSHAWRLSPLYAPLITCIGLAPLILPGFSHAVEVWRSDPEFSYGFLVPPIALFLIWRQRSALRRATRPGAMTGLVIVVAAIVQLLLGQRTGINVIRSVAIIPLLWGTAVYLWGWRVGRLLAFPLGFLVFGLGLYRGLLSSVGFVLQQITAAGAATAASLLGVPVAREGLTLVSTPEASQPFNFVVAEACSGMSSLLSLLTLAALWLYLARASLLGRVAVLASVLPLVIVANVTRVTSMLVVATWFGQDAALGFFEKTSNLILFGLAIGGLLLVSKATKCRFDGFASRS